LLALLLSRSYLCCLLLFAVMSLPFDKNRFGKGKGDP